jgi:hypothetical protein
LALGGVAVATPAYAAQNDQDVDAVATYAKLVDIVAPSVRNAYSGITGTVESVVTSTVQGMIGNPTAIKNLVTPLLKEAVKAKLSEYSISDPRIDGVIDQAVDAAVNNQIVDAILTNEFVQAVINRAIGYAVKDIVAQLGIAADGEAAITSIADHIWSAPRRAVPGTATTKVKSDINPPAACALGGCTNVSYHAFDVVSWNTLFGAKTTPKEIRVTAWSVSNINTYVTGAALVSTAGKFGEYQAKLSTMNYQQIITNAIIRAAQDEIRDRINAFVLQVKTQLVTVLKSELAKIGVTVNLNPNDSIQKIADQVVKALKGKTTAQIDQLLAFLRALCP